MSVGIYGNKSLASVDFNDVDVLFSFSPNRNELGDTQMKPLFDRITDNEFKKMRGADGAYKLRLPASVFNELGFYNVLIKPKSFETEIVDCSNVVTNNEQEVQISKKGIVIPRLQLQGQTNLVGYQIEYFDSNGQKIKNFQRIITSSDPVSLNVNNNNSNVGSTNYRLDDEGDQLFLTLTPDEASIISDEQSPDLGRQGQKVLITNTFFDPVMLEVEMVDQTIKTLSYALYGNSTKDEETGVFSIFDDNNNLFAQYNLLTQKKQFEEGKIDVKQRRNNIDLSRTFQEITQGL